MHMCYSTKSEGVYDPSYCYNYVLCDYNYPESLHFRSSYVDALFTYLSLFLGNKKLMSIYLTVFTDVYIN